VFRARRVRMGLARSTRTCELIRRISAVRSKGRSPPRRNDSRIAAADFEARRRHTRPRMLLELHDCGRRAAQEGACAGSDKNGRGRNEQARRNQSTPGEACGPVHELDSHANRVPPGGAARTTTP